MDDKIYLKNLLKNKIGENLSNKFKIGYEIAMILLAIIVVLILLLETFIDFTERISRILTLTDLYILIIFAIDYFTRLIFLANDRTYFIKNNVFRFNCYNTF